jgi:hypothetical protein
MNTLSESVSWIIKNLPIEDSMVVLASIEVARKRWTDEDTKTFGTVTRDRLQEKK